MKNQLSTQNLDLPRRTIALVLAGGRGSRLKNLTDERAKPAVHFGGKFRIIDFALSNCVNSGIRRIGVITQYKSYSLLRHIQRGWGFMKTGMNEFIDLLPAHQRVSDEGWYRGTAHAVYQNMDILKAYEAEYILVLAGDHIYKMNYAVMLADHVAKGCVCTVACITVPRKEANAFGVMSIDDNHIITEFVEKPDEPAAMPGQPDKSLASMGVYIFNAKYLYDALKADIDNPLSTHDFGKDIIPDAVRQGIAAAHPFDMSCVYSNPNESAYWRDVGAIDSYWDANMDLCATAPLLNLYDTRWPIWTYQEQLPPAKFVHDQYDRRGTAVESLVSSGCIVSGSLFRSVLFSSVRVHSYSIVNWSLLLPDVQIGRGARLTKVIVDRGCFIPEGMIIGEDAASDAQRFCLSEGGVTLVTQSMLEKLKTTN
jgi:glucose-1-phosphate adenylyltransferase